MRSRCEIRLTIEPGDMYSTTRIRQRGAVDQPASCAAAGPTVGAPEYTLVPGLLGLGASAGARTFFLEGTVKDQINPKRQTTLPHVGTAGTASAVDLEGHGPHTTDRTRQAAGHSVAWAQPPCGLTARQEQ